MVCHNLSKKDVRKTLRPFLVGIITGNMFTGYMTIDYIFTDNIIPAKKKEQIFIHSNNKNNKPGLLLFYYGLNRQNPNKLIYLIILIISEITANIKPNFIEQHKLHLTII